MLSSVNKVVLLGNVGDKIEFRHLENGGAICRFSVATDDFFTDKSSGEKKKLVDWHTVTSWGELAKEVYKSIEKGSLIYLEAKLKSRTWQSKEGITHKGYELFLQSFLQIGEKKQNTKKSDTYSTDDLPASPLPLTGFQTNDLDELPF
jgi:single-strand DNA-binding protein